MKLIFLDIDGVLNDEKFYKNRRYNKFINNKYNNINYKKVKLINNICDKTGAKVVISSSWRINMTVEELQELFVFFHGKFEVIGKTPMHGVLGNRGIEINEFLDTYGKENVEGYVIIDDDTDIQSNQLSNFVNTCYRKGITKKDCKKSIKILNSK